MILVFDNLSPNPNKSPFSNVRITKNLSSSFWCRDNGLLVLFSLPGTILNLCCPYGGVSFMMCILLTTLHRPFIIPYTVPLCAAMSFKITYQSIKKKIAVYTLFTSFTSKGLESLCKGSE